MAACIIWGLSPLYYKLLDHVPPLEVLAHRTVWSLITFALLLAAQRRLAALQDCLRQPRLLAILAFCAVMISVNWFLLIYSVQAERVTETSLGYYTFPLVAIALGVAVLGERPRVWQWLAIALAAVAVVVLTWGLGAAPWIALTLAVTFGFYSLAKKRTALGAVVSVTAEVVLLAPAAVIWLVVVHGQGGGHFGQDLVTTLLLALSGLMTALPLILFSYAAQRVSLTTIGLIQYLNPTLQFLCATVVLGETLTTWHGIAFGLIWTALAIYSVDGVASERASRRISMTSDTEAPTETKSRSDGSAKP